MSPLCRRLARCPLQFGGLLTSPGSAMLSRVPRTTAFPRAWPYLRAEKCGGFFEAGLSLIAEGCSAGMFEFVNKWQIDAAPNPAERPA